MKTVMQFLSLLLCFELVIGPVQGSLFLSAPAYAKDCPTGQEYSEAVNRCLTKADVLKVNSATQSCGGNSECYRTNATNALRDSSVSKENGGSSKAYDGENLFNSDGEYQNGKQKGIVKAANAVAIAIPLVLLTTVMVNKMKAKKAGNKYKCNPTSLLLIYGGGAALAVGEIYGYFNHKSKLKKIKEKWDKTVMPKDDSGVDKQRSDATEAQSEAFEFLAQNEDQVASTAKTKKGFYLAAAGLFAAGAIAAGLETYQLTVAKAQLLPTDLGPDGKTNTTNDPAARQKINKLTCNSDKDGIDQESEDKEKTAKSEAEQKAIDDKVAANDDKMLANDKEILKNEKELSELQAKDPKTPAEERMIKRLEERNTSLGKANEKIEAENTKLTTPPKPATQGGGTTGGASGGADDYNSSPDECKSPRTWVPADDDNSGYCKGASYKPKPNIEKMQRVAAHNISTAKNAEQFAQLMNEMESIELENYSKVNYLEDYEKIAYKDVSLPYSVAKAISDSLIPPVHAGEGGGALAAIATAIPLLTGLKSIVGGIKFNGGTPLSATQLNETNRGITDGFTKAISKPVTRLAISGVLGGWMGLMSHFMDKQQRRSSERAAMLRKMKEEFASANGLIQCKEEDRADATKPKCYCFTSDNKFNPERSKDKVCANSLAKMKYDPFGNGASDKVCLDQNSNVDTACACRAKKSCMNITSNLKFGGFSPGSFKMIGAGSAPAQDLFNGNVGGGDIADSAGINAARMQKAATDMLAKIDPKAAKAKNSFAAGLEKGLISSGAGLSMGSGGGGSSLPSSPAAAAAALDKEIKDSKDEDAITTAGGDSSPAVPFTSEEQPEFGLTEAAANEQEIEIAEVMGQELDTGNSDINTGSSTNLFEVLSNRYRRSGMKRLSDDSTGPVDAPNKKEIVE